MDTAALPGSCRESSELGSSVPLNSPYPGRVKD